MAMADIEQYFISNTFKKCSFIEPENLEPGKRYSLRNRHVFKTVLSGDAVYCKR